MLKNGFIVEIVRPVVSTLSTLSLFSTYLTHMHFKLRIYSYMRVCVYIVTYICFYIY